MRTQEEGVYPVAKIHLTGSGSNKFCLAMLVACAHSEIKRGTSVKGPRTKAMAPVRRATRSDFSAASENHFRIEASFSHRP
jgi:hypothetical protein